ncbi:MAG: FAD binding domain-containing protein [Spirochaetales bacterium]|nr:FAD binding domain-containing protein [Spirochaetales bacterium]
MINTFYKASDVKEILTFLTSHNENTGILAGGTDINRLNSQSSYKSVIDISEAGLQEIKRTESGIEIGACVTFQQALESKFIPSYLGKALRYAGSRTLRNMATIGGNAALQRSDSYLLPVLIAAKARLITTDLSEDGTIIEENVPIREYIEHRNMFQHTLIVRICLNKPERFVASERFCKSIQAPPSIVIGFGADYSEQKKVLNNLRIVIGTAFYGIYRLQKVEEAVAHGVIQTAEELEKAVVGETKAVSDYTGSEAYKKYLAGTAAAHFFIECQTAAGRF